MILLFIMSNLMNGEPICSCVMYWIVLLNTYYELFLLSVLF